MLAPICLFTYNRPAELKQTIDALKRNYLASESELYIFSDGAKDQQSDEKVFAVRQYLETVTGFKSVSVSCAPVNRGLANSIIAGVSKLLAQYGKVIVLEDDLITSPNFLDFMNQALVYYEKNKKIMSISGYTMDLPSLKNRKDDFYLGYRAGSWGWGIWQDRWELVDWEAQSYQSFRWSFLKQFRFMRGGMDMPYMLWKQMTGRLDSWAIRLGYCQFEHDLLTVFPVRSKVKSIGFGEEATNTKKSHRFRTHLDDGLKMDFEFSPAPVIDPLLVKEFRGKFSLRSRIVEKFKLA
ncbi:glycosyltransferase [Sunxiuqinia rutila]|uniref:glycosyltransferase n=1 Tax=Sunxiuqinia rutila TaxID=1397841 RepID=UPI003D360F14